MTPSTWSRGCEAVDRNGLPVSLESEKAVGFCIYGAVLREMIDQADLGDLRYVRGILDEAAMRASRNECASIFDYNDREDVTFDDCQRVFRIALTLVWRDAGSTRNDGNRHLSATSRRSNSLKPERDHDVEALLAIAWREKTGQPW